MLTTRLIAPLVAVACLAATTLPATDAAAKKKKDGPMGAYGGYAVHESTPAWVPEDAEPFKSRLSIRIGRYSRRDRTMRVTGIAGTIRTFCQEVMVKDVRIVKMHFKGPEVSRGGSFAIRVQGISFEGQANGHTLVGYASGGNQECGVSGVRFTLDRSMEL
jgi:hypothetical protein